MARLKPVVARGRSRGQRDCPHRRGGRGQDTPRGRAGGGGPRHGSSRAVGSLLRERADPAIRALARDPDERRGRRRDDARLAGLPLPMRRELGRLLPELWPADGDTAPAANYLVLFEGVSRLLEQAADGRAHARCPRGPPLGRRDEPPAARVHRAPPCGLATGAGRDRARGGPGRRADASADLRRAGARAPRRHRRAALPVAGEHGGARPRARARGSRRRRRGAPERRGVAHERRESPRRGRSDARRRA